MIRHDYPQGGEQWIAARLAVITASRLDSMMTGGGKVSKAKGVLTYRNELVAEALLRAPLDDTQTQWMQRGTEMEPQARAHYALYYAQEPVEVGFLTTDDGRVGASPDGLCGEDGGLELKCPGAKAHVGYLIDPATLAAKYKHQTQGGLYVSGRKWWDIASYCPSPGDMPDMVVMRCWPDLEYQMNLDEAVAQMVARVDAALKQIRDIDPTAHLDQAGREQVHEEETNPISGWTD